MSEILHIGDNLLTDVAGANRAGAISVWLNRDGALPEVDEQPDFEVKTLSAIPGLIATNN